jgi:hypothetical protein
MKLMWETEYWREQMLDAIDSAEHSAGVTMDSSAFDETAKELRDRVVNRLYDGGFRVTWSYQQSVGALVLFQSGTPSERAAVDSAVESESDWYTNEVAAEVRGFLQGSKE